MTRRFEPMAGTASSAEPPFHPIRRAARFFGDDAVSIEATANRELAEMRPDTVNSRRDRFTPQHVLDASTQHSVTVLDFDAHSTVHDFRMDRPLRHLTLNSD